MIAETSYSPLRNAYVILTSSLTALKPQQLFFFLLLLIQENAKHSLGVKEEVQKLIWKSHRFCRSDAIGAPVLIMLI